MAADHIILVAGDVAPPPSAVLTDARGLPLDLAGVQTVKFRLVEYHSDTVRVDNQVASVLQVENDPNTLGWVVYYWRPGDTSVPGLYRGFFVVDWGNGPQTFPPTGDYYILIEPRM
jgi:hypothetical protein